MITIQIDSRPLQNALANLELAGRDLRPALNAIAMELVSQTEANLAAEGRPKWQPLAASTIAQREKHGTWPGKILQVSSGGLAADISTEVGPTFVRVGSGKEYAAIHQLGGTIQRAAYSKQVRHRTNAKGELLRTAGFNGKGLVLNLWRKLSGYFGTPPP